MKQNTKAESAPGLLPVGVSYSIFDELQAEAAPAKAGSDLKAVPCNLAIPTFDAAGKVVGAHNLPVHLLTVDGRTNTGYGIAWVFAGEAEAVKLANRYNSHSALLEALKDIADTCANPAIVPDNVVDRIGRVARAAIAQAERGEK